MKAILAVSADGYLAKSQNDDMQWLGHTDKAIFRILTGSGGGYMAASRNTVRLMPSRLSGRTLVALSSQGKTETSWGTLHEFSIAHPRAWLIGGPKLVLHALEAEMLNEVHICRSSRCANPDPDALSIEDELTPWLKSSSARFSAERAIWVKDMQTTLDDVCVELWRPYVVS